MNNEAFKEELKATEKEVAMGVERDSKILCNQFNDEKFEDESFFGIIVDALRSIFTCNK